MSGPVERRRAWRVVRKMEAELRHQLETGLLTDCGTVDETGHVRLSGTLDLAALAYIVEQALISEFRT